MSDIKGNQDCCRGVNFFNCAGCFCSLQIYVMHPITSPSDQVGETRNQHTPVHLNKNLAAHAQDLSMPFVSPNERPSTADGGRDV